MKCPECGGRAKLVTRQHQPDEVVLSLECRTCGSFRATVQSDEFVSSFVPPEYVEPYYIFYSKITRKVVKEEEGGALIAVAIFVALAIVLVALALRLGLPIDPTWVFKAIGG